MNTRVSVCRFKLRPYKGSSFLKFSEELVTSDSNVYPSKNYQMKIQVKFVFFSHEIS